MTNDHPHRVFDRVLWRRRQERAGLRFSDHDFLFEEVADRLADRLDDVTRGFPTALDLGSRGNALARRLAGRKGIETLVSAAPSPVFARSASGLAVTADEEALPFADAVFDLVVGVLSLHWVNDLPGALAQIRRALKPDGFFCAAMLGGDTLIELRRCLLEAELERSGGAAPRVSPFAGVRDVGNLLHRAGFALPVADGDVLTVTYPDPFALLRDLRGMGEGNALLTDRRVPLRRAVILDAAHRYAERHAEPDGRVRATFEVVYLAGWAPHESQPKPLRPGSATTPLADALNRG